MKSGNPRRTEQKLNNAIDACKRLNPEAVFAGFTNEAFATKVAPSFATRAKLKEIRLDFAKWLMSRKGADIESMYEYQRLIHGIRCHPDHGNNSPILHACGYVMELKQETGLVRPSNTEAA